MANIVDAHGTLGNHVRSARSDAASLFCPSPRHVCASVTNFSENFAADLRAQDLSETFARFEAAFDRPPLQNLPGASVRS